MNIVIFVLFLTLMCSSNVASEIATEIPNDKNVSKSQEIKMMNFENETYSTIDDHQNNEEQETFETKMPLELENNSVESEDKPIQFVEGSKLFSALDKHAVDSDRKQKKGDRMNNNIFDYAKTTEPKEDKESEIKTIISDLKQSHLETEEKLKQNNVDVDKISFSDQSEVIVRQKKDIQISSNTSQLNQSLIPDENQNSKEFKKDKQDSKIFSNLKIASVEYKDNQMKVDHEKNSNLFLEKNIIAVEKMQKHDELEQVSMSNDITSDEASTTKVLEENPVLENQVKNYTSNFHIVTIVPETTHKEKSFQQDDAEKKLLSNLGKNLVEPDEIQTKDNLFISDIISTVVSKEIHKIRSQEHGNEDTSMFSYLDSSTTKFEINHKEENIERSKEDTKSGLNHNINFIGLDRKQIKLNQETKINSGSGAVENKLNNNTLTADKKQKQESNEQVSPDDKMSAEIEKTTWSPEAKLTDSVEDKEPVKDILGKRTLVPEEEYKLRSPEHVDPRSDEVDKSTLTPEKKRVLDSSEHYDPQKDELVKNPLIPEKIGKIDNVEKADQIKDDIIKNSLTHGKKHKIDCPEKLETAKDYVCKSAFISKECKINSLQQLDQVKDNKNTSVAYEKRKIFSSEQRDQAIDEVGKFTTVFEDKKKQDILQHVDSDKNMLNKLDRTFNKMPKEEQHEKKSIRNMFVEFLAKFNKSYKNTKEYEYRFLVFKENLDLVKQMNNIILFAKFGVTQFMDVSRNETIKHNKCLRIKQSTSTHINKKANSPKIKLKRIQAPDVWDWRKQNVITEPGDQGSCQSCWAFASNSVIESQYAIKHELQALSVQQILDCSEWRNNCLEGNPEEAITRQAELIGGVVAANKYRSYRQEKGRCWVNKKNVVARVTSGEVLNITDEDLLKLHIFENGPVVAGMVATFPFLLYKGGVVTSKDLNCTENMKLNYAVTIVGYGVDKQSGLPYWILKNSFGQEWGDRGYMYLHRGSNACNITNYLVEAIVK